MEAKFRANKDVAMIEVYQKTDIARLALWEIGMGEELGKSIVIETGSDGNFMVKVMVGLGLMEEDEKNIYKSVKGIKLTTENGWYLGSPEWRGNKEKMGEEQNCLDVVRIEKGNYLVDVYSLLVKDSEGNPKFIQFAYAIFPEAKYLGAERNLPTEALKLNYVKE